MRAYSYQLVDGAGSAMPEQVDAALRHFGMPMGAADARLAGLDVS